MRQTQRVGALTAVIGALVCGVPTTHGQVNGNASITAPVFGLPLTVTTSNQFAGAVSSIQWGGKEFINNWDHGRQLQPNGEFFNRYECYNPYEAGSKIDGNKPTTSSRLLTLSASGNRLDSTTQMAWYVSPDEAKTGEGAHCGDPSQWLPAPAYTQILSNYRVHKTVTIGFAGISNVIEYLSELYIPEVVQKGIIQITAVTPYDFSSVWTYDVVSKDYRNVRLLSGEDDLVKILATPDGAYAMGFYSPELLQPYGNGGAGGYRWGLVPPDPVNYPDVDFPASAVGSVNRFDSFNGPGFANDRAYLVIGNMDQVRDGLSKLHYQFRQLDPNVFNWREYVAINHLPFATQKEAEDHWINQGIAQGLTASSTFSSSQYLKLNPDVANVFGSTNYQAAIDHYISAGRSEGRNTVARPAAGMQHLLVLANRNLTASGQNAFGQLSSGDLATTATEVAAGDYSSFAVKSDGSLWVWGSNQYGAHGDGSIGDNITTPAQVPIPARITTPSRAGKHAIAVATSAYAAIDTEGHVWTWGANWNGRLGDGTTTSRYTPERVKKSSAPNDYLTGIVSIAGGGGTMAAIDADGTVWTWGAGASGALGNGAMQDSAYPVQVIHADANNVGTPLVGVSQVACGSSGFCIALTRFGQVLGWGNNDFSQLGVAAGGALSIANPIAIGAGFVVDTIAAGSAHAIAHSIDGNVYGWGYNGRGQLGTGAASVAQFPPVAMNRGPDNMSDIGDLMAGTNFSMMVRNSDRTVFVVGDNQSGQLGIPGSPATQYVPARSAVTPSRAD